MASESTRKKAQSRRHFDRWSRSYESDPSSRRLAALQQAALDALALESGDRLLDVGCGSGAAVRHAAPTVERAIGVDLSPGMIERARGLGCQIRGPLEHTPSSRGFYLSDPDGRRLEFTHDDRGVYWRE